MSSLGSPNPFFIAGKKAYEVKRSLRFNNDDSAYLSRTPSSTGNRKTFTISFWFKRGNMGANQKVFTAGTSGQEAGLQFYDGSTENTLRFYEYTGSDAILLAPNRLLRDSSAWYHVVIGVDTTQSTASNRVKYYINGVQETSFATATYPSQNYDTKFNTSSSTNYIGFLGSHSAYFDGYIAEVNFIDGLALDSSYFGETDAITGQWNPKKYVGSYGTNGFYLNFSDNSGTTATTLGKDSSGNGNNFTPNNFSVAAGAGNDSLEDTPTNNFPTINPLDGGTNALLTNGNLTFKPNSSNSGNFNVFYSTFSMRSGKWYFEVLIVNENSGSNSIQFGIGSYKYKRDSTNQNGNVTGLTLINTNNSNSAYRKGVVDGSTVGSSVSTSSTNDVYGVAFDADNKKVYFYKNGSAEGESSGYNVTDVGTGDFFFFSTLRYSTGGSYSGGDSTLAVNFGQRAFSYTAPTGYKKLCSANLPDPTILLPNNHFNTVTYSGSNSNQSITGVGFQPDWVWIKNRSSTPDHMLNDAVRGAGKQINSNTTSAELDRTYFQSFDSDGFSLEGNVSDYNKSGSDFVAWNWNAGDTDGKTYTVKVVSDSGNKYRFDDFGTSAVTLDLAEGGTYIFDQSDSSNAGHPLRFYTAADKTGGEYTTGVTTAGTAGSSGAYTQIVVAASAPTLFYQCSAHAGMGGQANTNSTLGSSNFAGAIQSTVKVNATAGFSITAYSGNGSNAQTVGHGLGVAPDAIILKARGASQNWRVWHRSLAADGSKRLLLDSSNASEDAGFLNDTAPTSTLFTLGNSDDAWNASGGTYITYLFSEVAGYSKFGSYQGNGSSDGSFVFTGFSVRWLMVKRTDDTDNWSIYDTARDTTNVMGSELFANVSNAEQSNSSDIDFVSNGFKFRRNYTSNNGSGTFIYLAFAEAPFRNARAR